MSVWGPESARQRGGVQSRARCSIGERGVRTNAGGCIPLPRCPQVKCHQTAFRNIWNDLYGAKESGRGAGRGGARPWDSGARASRTAPPARAAPPPAFQRASLRIYSAATRRAAAVRYPTLPAPGLLPITLCPSCRLLVTPVTYIFIEWTLFDY